MSTAMSSSPLSLFAGRVVRRGEPDYELFRYQYATTSRDPTTMAPAVILVPRDTADVLRALEYADQHALAIALRTGGHQLSGASSTAGDNLLLDLRHTWPVTTFHPDRDHVEAGVSQHLGAFHAQLASRGLFLPHGQCQHVMLGGHVQTGGSGMLARAFGLMSDHVEAFEILTADGRLRMIRRDTTDPDDRDLYWAVLGGSPGSFGILTRVFFRPLRDAHHPDSRGLKFLVPYSKERLHRVLDVMAELTADDALAADHDLTVTVLGAAQLNTPWQKSRGLDEHMRARHPDHYGRDGHRLLPQAIIVYGQWSNTGGPDQPFDPSLFERIKRAAGYGRGNGLVATAFENALNRIRLDGSPLGISPSRPTPISRLTAAWMFLNVREYALPYVKRVYLSNRTDLPSTGWATETARHFDTMVSHPHHKPLLQVQHQGGRHSRYRTNHGDDLTAHSWRSDTTLVALLDCFHPDEGPGPTPARREAEAWQYESDRIFLGERRFATEDRRFA
ncbi:MAG TPA: FAD-dependent oxidoreductase, partial [Myxococcota bacterium]|nr:FAD-dependent oxidoreductase [Myxococcota bacterium]